MADFQLRLIYYNNSSARSANILCQQMMNMSRYLPLYILGGLLSVLILSGCYKKEIEFSGDPANSYSRLVFTDTVGVQLATAMSDSFATGGATSFLVGRYKDPYLGSVTCSPFFQLSNLAASVDIPVTAVFDSMVLILHPNKYWYGDTTKAQTFTVSELAVPINYSYNSKLYNTTDVATVQPALGARTLRISPQSGDSILVKLDPAKGQEIFQKLVDKSTDLTDADAFQNYFKGIKLSVPSQDSAAVFGLTGSADMVMRVLYHTTVPLEEKKYVDFPMSVNDFAFNQIIPDHSGTLLPAVTPGFHIIPSTQTGNVSFTQSGAGLMAKMTFPSLRDVIRNDNLVKLLKAELIVRPAPQSFDAAIYKLPDLELALTNGSNIVGQTVTDSSGVSQVISPSIDALYGEGTHYRFDITSYIQQLLTTAGAEDYGVFMFQELDLSAMQINRAVINDGNQSGYKTQLLLSFVVIDK